MRKLYTFPIILLAFLVIQHFCCFPIQARWGTYEDAPSEVEFFNSDIVVNEEGKSVEIVEKQVKVLNESGRGAFSVERIHYNESIEKVEIIEAKTIIDGKEYIVPKDMIETKPLASEIQGFDQLFQILISYPHVGVGSRVYLKYKSIVSKQPLPKYFASKYYYGSGGAYWKKAKFTVKSEIPFNMILNDPNTQFEVKEYKEGKYQILEAISQKPAYHDLVNEAPSNQIPDNLKTWIYISTYDTPDDLSKALAKDFEKVIQQDLPPLQEAIRKEAAKATNPVDQINMITSLLADKIRYMGDWRTIEGKIAPRPLKTVADSGVGDCKDFASSTAAILNTLGYKVQAAIVMRGIAYLPPAKTLPSLLDYNHAILKATAKDGKVFWIDATNFTSMADGIFPDIADRPVLVLDSKNPSLEHIPNIDYQHSKITFSDAAQIKDGGVLSDVGSIEFSGEQAQESTGAGLSFSLQSIEESIIKQLTGESSPSKKKVTLPPLDSRIVRDFKIDFSYEQENNLLLTNAGPGILLRVSWSQPFIDTSECQKGTTFVGLPVTLIKKTIIQDVDAKLAEALAYEFKAPWVESKRECRVVDNGVEINERTSILKSFVTAEEAKSKQYKDFKDIIKKYCNKIAIIVSKKDTKESAASPLARGG